MPDKTPEEIQELWLGFWKVVEDAENGKVEAKTIIDFAHALSYDDDIKAPLLLIGVCDIACGIFQYVGTFLIRGRIHFFFYLGRVIIPEMIYTVIFAVFLYQLNYYVNKKTMGSYY